MCNKCEGPSRVAEGAIRRLKMLYYRALNQRRVECHYLIRPLQFGIGIVWVTKVF